MIQQLFESASVFVLSAFNLYYGFMLSTTYRQGGVEQFLLMSGGSWFGILACLFLGARLIALWNNKIARKSSKNKEEKNKEPFLTRVWKRYGIWGLAFCTGFIGTIPTVTISLISGIDRNLILWYLGGAKIVWSIIFAWVGQAALSQLIEALF